MIRIVELRNAGLILFMPQATAGYENLGRKPHVESGSGVADIRSALWRSIMRKNSIQQHDGEHHRFRQYLRTLYGWMKNYVSHLIATAQKALRFFFEIYTNT